MPKHVLLLHFMMLLAVSRARMSIDYWSAEYDTSKNCLQEKKIVQLRNKVREKILKRETLLN